MFCDEKILKVYRVEDDGHGHDAFLDCYHDLAYHCTEGYRIVFETESYAISLSAKGVIKERKDDLRDNKGEWLQNGVEIPKEEEPETTLFVGETLLSVVHENEIYLLQFDDFTFKVVPHANGDSIPGLHNQDHRSYHHVFGCDRHLKGKCPHCGGDGEILLDFVCDYVVRCQSCKKSTCAEMQLRHAIDHWNNGEVYGDLSDIAIE